VSPRDLAAEYEKQRPSYLQLSALVAERLKELTRLEGLRPSITHRTKDIRSLVRKCMRFDGPVDKVRDKSGVKIVVRYEFEVELVRNIIERSFDCSEGDDKVNGYLPNELGYLGTHYHIRLREDDCPSEVLGLECEIILHTGAETLWDNITHELLYKPYVKLPVPSQRSLHRLLALVELFDKEVTAVRTEYTTSEGYDEARMLDILEKYFYRLDAREYSRPMSIHTLEALAPIVGKDRINRLDDEISNFVTKFDLELKNVYTKYREDDDYRGTFLHQPESLLIFALFEWNQIDAVKRAWIRLYPRDALEELGALWAITIPR
jgi:ppGpp synthetase/RelA/SpoT-type nucleotidyltranferase